MDLYFSQTKIIGIYHFFFFKFKFGSFLNVLQGVAESVKQDFGSIDILVHSLANGPEVLKFP